MKAISMVFPFTDTLKGVFSLAFALLFKKRELVMLVPEKPFNIIAEPLVALFPVKLQFSTLPANMLRAPPLEAVLDAKLQSAKRPSSENITAPPAFVALFCVKLQFSTAPAYMLAAPPLNAELSSKPHPTTLA